ncbi:MAG TPA: heme lyase CcmF/NrfE family subunit [Thermomicrobiales bacterium]|nr:cytochrome C biogenesis protein [Chloroflexota bacterium]HCG29685.1 cytochrome C biogenesis protein [Chloroflexota bacterium]HQZ89823.1 heme lyase CcmF/NrfE family subunit [Thermomicrobiales bacterium]HRA30451.1 heme lyase CcmF/NrfE family subunit [Thermomicrobiales bacterium]
MAQLAHGALLLALVTAFFGIGAAVFGERRRIPELSLSAVRAVVGVTFLLLVADAILLTAFITHDFSFAYVSSRSSSDMPLRYVVTAFYGGQEGSLLFWTTMASILASIAFVRNRARFPRLVPHAAATFLALSSFFLLMLTMVRSPFEINAIVPAQGQGLNPLLRDPGMLIHPPMLLSGFASFSVPFSIAIGALISGRMTREWLGFVRTWALVAWAILGTGIFLGGWWAYHVLGWGGYWGWDPVENVSLLPWLTGTAFIHSVIVQERRGMLKVWNMGLLLASYVLAIFGTFVVRSGLIQSVHTFAVSSIGPFFLGYLTLVTVVAIGLMIYRMPMLQSENTFDAVLSRETGFLLNNLVFAGIAFATFWGTIYPIVSEAATGSQLTVGPPFYRQVNGPLFAVMLVLMGIGPLLAWRKTTLGALRRAATVPMALALLTIVALLFLFGQPPAAIGVAAAVFAIGAVGVEYWRGAAARRRSTRESLPAAVVGVTKRNPRRYGGYIVHLGVAVIAIGIIGTQFFQSERQVMLNPGESVQVAEYTLTFNGLERSRIVDADVYTANIDVSSGGRDHGVIHAKRFFFDGFEQQPTTRVAVKTTGFDDVYVMLTEWNDGGAAGLHIFINPLVPWVWVGGLIYMMGMLIVFWPAPVPRRVAITAPARGKATGEATA